MELNELKQTIEQRTGVPASLLTGETAEENIAQARALLAYRKEYEQQRPKDASEQFSEWFNSVHGIVEQDHAGEALADIEAQAAADPNSYPEVHDSGELDGALVKGTPREQFGEWFSEHVGLDLTKDENGWKRII